MAEQPKKSAYRSAKRGPLLISEHGDRRMKTYLVTQNELKQLSAANRWATLFWSLAASCASLWFGVWADMLIEGSPSSVAISIIPIIQWGLAGACVVFIVLAIVAKRDKSSCIDVIKGESSLEAE